MKKTFSTRSGACVAAIVALAGTAPAMADDFDIGPAKVTLGGFLATEGVYRSRTEQADIGSSFSGIPFSNAAQAHTSESRFTARQSRLSLLAQGDANSDTHLAMYGEFDFLGAAQSANSNESNSYNLRVRNLYGTVDWDSLGLELLAGQSWSLVTLNTKGITPRNELPPATIDAQYAVGFSWARQPQIRVVKNWNHQFWLALSVESPQTTFAANSSAASGISALTFLPGGPLFDKNNNYSLNHIPDVIGKMAWEPKIGDKQPLHVEVFGLLRSYYDRVSVAGTNALGLPAGKYNNDSQGGGVGGSIIWSAVPGVLDLQATAMTGQGIGRYGTSQLPDVTLRPDGTLTPIHEDMLQAGVTLHASPYLDLYVYGGQEEEGAHYFNVGTAHLGLGNPGYNVAGCFYEGGSCSPNLRAASQITGGFWWKLYNGKFGSFRYGMQYSYTHLTAFAGAGGKPQTDDSMIFTSLRYYPF
ncbi:MAG: hypothetical protein J0G99_03475 [Alphaproteobacteria bacterium]|nr:hypothetical protein [Alphaproteobacteria bacterium]